MSLKAKFTDHPETVGETYAEHFASAMGFTFSMLGAAFCCAVHAILPFCFEKTGSRCIKGLYEKMVANRSRLETTPVTRRATDDAQALGEPG